ncbi:MAG: nucleotide exchange factor GrpE [Chloroflexota bacterium]
MTDSPEFAATGEAPPAGDAIDAAALLAERDALVDQVQRARADYANLKRRSEQELERARAAATERILREVLPVLDDLQDGLAHIPPDAQDGIANGMRLVEQKFQAALGRLGVAPVESLGQPFDPSRHEAVDFDPAGGQHVASVYRQGYRMGDTLLRPAVVKVGQPPS